MTAQPKPKVTPPKTGRPVLKAVPQPKVQTKADKVGNLPKTFKRTTVGLEIVGAITLEKWLEGFATLEKTGRGHQWWIGDALNEGETRFKEDYAQAIDPVEEEKRANEGNDDTYRMYQQVACRIPIRRRRQNLYFGHHQTVAYLSEQEQEDWLDLAVKDGLSVNALRKKIKKSKEGGAENEPALDIQVLQDPAIRQWLEDYRALIVKHGDELPEVAGADFLHQMMCTHVEHVIRQLERTLAIDCGVVKRAVAFMLSVSSEIIAKAMKVRGYFMSKADLDDRLQLLIDLGEIKKEKAEEERHEGQKGDVVWKYKMTRNGADKDDGEWL